MSDPVFAVRFRWTPFDKAVTESCVKQFQEAHGVYQEQYEACIYISAPTFLEAEQRALEVARHRFPETMAQPGTTWTLATTHKVSEGEELFLRGFEQEPLYAD